MAYRSRRQPPSGGQAELFFRAFVSACALSIEPGAIGTYRVRTEYRRAESTVDIVVYRAGEFLIYIENKIDAVEGPGQLDREYRDMQKTGAFLGIGQDLQFAVFLTPDGRAPISGDPNAWHTVSYATIAAAVAEVLPQVTIDKVRALVHDWIDVVQDFGGASW